MAARHRSPFGARPRSRALLGVGGPAPRPFRAPPAKSRHLGRGGGLVDEDEPVRIEIELAFKPGFARLLHIGSLLLGGMRGLFLYVIPRRAKKRQIVVTPKGAPRSIS